jgi:DnaJ-class molecular chaperone
MAGDNNLYAVLGVARHADGVVIQAAYRALAKRDHPDLAKVPKAIAEARFRKICEAYEVLSDPRRRADYDAELDRLDGVQRYEAPPSEQPGAGPGQHQQARERREPIRPGRVAKVVDTGQRIASGLLLIYIGAVGAFVVFLLLVAAFTISTGR